MGFSRPACNKGPAGAAALRQDMRGTKAISAAAAAPPPPRRGHEAGRRLPREPRVTRSLGGSLTCAGTCSPAVDSDPCPSPLSRPGLAAYGHAAGRGSLLDPRGIASRDPPGRSSVDPSRPSGARSVQACDAERVCPCRPRPRRRANGARPSGPSGRSEYVRDGVGASQSPSRDRSRGGRRPSPSPGASRRRPPTGQWQSGFAAAPAPAGAAGRATRRIPGCGEASSLPPRPRSAAPGAAGPESEPAGPGPCYGLGSGRRVSRARDPGEILGWASRSVHASESLHSSRRRRRGGRRGRRGGWRRR